MQSRGCGSTLLKMIWKKTQGWSESWLIKAIHVVSYVCSALLFGFGEDILIQTFFFYLVQLEHCVSQSVSVPTKTFFRHMTSVLISVLQ